jgi:hypothetical protein
MPLCDNTSYKGGRGGEGKKKGGEIEGQAKRMGREREWEEKGKRRGAKRTDRGREREEFRSCVVVEGRRSVCLLM